MRNGTVLGWAVSLLALFAIMMIAHSARGAITTIESWPRYTTRNCDTSQAGDIPPDWRTTHAIIAGPMTMYLLHPVANLRPSRPVRNHPGLFVVQKAIIDVPNGYTVTISVPRYARTRVALFYARDSLGRALNGPAMRIKQGQVVVTFQSCPRADQETDTQFGGGFIIAGARCARLGVTVIGQGRFTLALPAGVACQQTSA
jgi:hypothetical protein